MYAPPPQNVLGRWIGRIVELVLPAPCLACGSAVDRPRRSLGLCPSCRRRLSHWPADGCACCGRAVEGPAARNFRCGPCRDRPPAYDRLRCGFCYRPPLDAVITGLKFKRLDYLGEQLGRALLARLEERSELPSSPDLVVPVPLHWRRRLSRGYNQAALIARPLALGLRVPQISVLLRRRPTPPQSRLTRAARLINPRGAFALRRGARCAGRSILLVDDVVTTGATLAAAAACLRRAGAREIVALAAARTPG